MWNGPYTTNRVGGWADRMSVNALGWGMLGSIQVEPKVRMAQCSASSLGDGGQTDGLHGRAEPAPGKTIHDANLSCILVQNQCSECF